MSHSGRGAKRRRAVVACNSCRHRKSRCDGGRPCAQCNELGCDCIYQDVGASCNLTVEKSYLARLEHRLRDVEASLRKLEQNQSNIPSAPLQLSQSEVDSSTNPLDGGLALPTPPKSNPVSQGRAEFGEIDISENSIDGMGAINFTDEEDCGFFGPSSNIAFMRHISRAIAKGGTNHSHASSPSLSSPNHTGGGMLTVSRSHPSQDEPQSQAQSFGKSEVNIFALPSEGRTWRLIQIYFEKTGQLLPFIHEASFCETYFRMREDNFRRVRRTWLGLLNIVLAIATSLHTEGDLPAGKRIQESDIYFQRANGLCDRDSKRNASLEMVQYLLILGQYLQGTQKSVQAWTTHGLAISAAFQLGLHSPDANRRFPPLESEIRKRTWYGCILLDRTLSMTFGRPCTIPESYVKLDIPLPDFQVLSSSPTSTVYPQLDGQFFTAAMSVNHNQSLQTGIHRNSSISLLRKLYVVMFNVLDTCYCQNLGFEHPLTTENSVPQILEGERQLEEWRGQVVPNLGIQLWQTPLLANDLAQMDQESTIRHRFGIVLSVRYHNLRILLYRRFLEGYLDSYGSNESSQENKLLHQIGISGMQNCIESAQSIITTVHTITASNDWRRGLLGAWNYSLYYTFNAGLVIFGALLVASKECRHHSDLWNMATSSRPYLDLAAEALQRLDSGNRVIERCVEYLTQLSKVLRSKTLGNALSPYQAYPSEFASPNGPNHDLWSNVDLGEFMIDDDLDLLGRMFNSSHPQNAAMDEVSTHPVGGFV